jgi:hypothetical protein
VRKCSADHLGELQIIMSLSSALASWKRMSEGSRLARVLFRVVLIVVLLYAAVGAWGAYRAWVQVRQLDMKVVSPDLRPGMPAVVQVITSGRTFVDVRLELVQGSYSEMLATLRVAPSHDGFFDPRKREGSMMPVFTPEFLAHFKPGPAVLRATAVGRPLWLREPAPVTQEIPVVVPAP